jgi:hypothetical protein
VEAWKGPKADKAAGGGGGGGDHSAVDASKGKLPKREDEPKEPPQVQALDKPKLAMEAAINVQKDLILPDNPMMPNIGVKNSLNVKLASNGQGGGTGFWRQHRRRAVPRGRWCLGAGSTPYGGSGVFR